MDGDSKMSPKKEKPSIKQIAANIDQITWKIVSMEIK
jgi:hypothetical protein